MIVVGLSHASEDCSFVYVNQGTITMEPRGLSAVSVSVIVRSMVIRKLDNIQFKYTSLGLSMHQTKNKYAINNQQL